jgi:isoleucyl-tRNA synthetase
MLFIVSQVVLETGGPDGVSVSVARAEGEKCERCWRTVAELARDSRVAGLCERCVDALSAGDGREVA